MLSTEKHKRGVLLTFKPTGNKLNQQVSSIYTYCIQHHIVFTDNLCMFLSGCHWRQPLPLCSIRCKQRAEQHVTAHIGLERPVFIRLGRICCTTRMELGSLKSVRICLDTPSACLQLSASQDTHTNTCTDSITSSQPPHKQDEETGLRQGYQPLSLGCGTIRAQRRKKLYVSNDQ